MTYPDFSNNLSRPEIDNFYATKGKDFKEKMGWGKEKRPEAKKEIKLSPETEFSDEPETPAELRKIMEP